MEPAAEIFAFNFRARLTWDHAQIFVEPRAHTCLGTFTNVFKEICTAVVDEELICQREPFNTADPFAVAVVKNSTAVGHACSQENIVCLSLFLV